MTRLGWFLTGAVAMLILEASALAGAVASLKEPPPVEPNVNVVRQMTFKVMAPKNFEDVAYVELDCQPNLRRTRKKNVMKGNDKWRLPVVSAPLATVEVIQ